MKNNLLIAILLFSNTLMAENILVKTKKSVSIFDTKTSISKIILDLTREDRYYSIGVPIKGNDSLLFLLYNNVEYAGFSFKKKIHEKEYLYKDGICSLLNTSTVEPLGNAFLIKSEKRNGTIAERKLEQLKDRYFIEFKPQHVNPYISIDGNIYTKHNGEQVCILASTSQKSKKIKCGYSEPDLSPDGNYLICYRRCSKFNNKKNIGDATLIELDLQTGKINELNIGGVSPLYSPKGKYILIKSNDKYLILDRLNDYKLVKLTDATEAYWIP